MRVPQAPGCPPICSPGGRLPLTMLRMYGQSGRDVGGPPVPFSTVPKATPTLPGPASQVPLLQAKFVVISVGALVVAAVAVPAAPRLPRNSAGVRIAAARQSLDDMLLPPHVGAGSATGRRRAQRTGECGIQLPHSPRADYVLPPQTDWTEATARQQFTTASASRHLSDGPAMASSGRR